jgi:hypothetical protein
MVYKLAFKLLSRVLVTLTPVGNRKSDVAFFGHTVTVDHDGTRQRYFKKLELEVGKRCYSVYEVLIPSFRVSRTIRVRTTRSRRAVYTLTAGWVC